MTSSRTDNYVEDKDNFLVSYAKLPEKSLTTVRFFDRDDKYTLYGNDAVKAAEDSPTTSRNRVRRLHNASLSLTIDYINLKKHEFEVYVRDLLLLKQRRVEVWVNQGKNEWVAEYKGSPGNLTQFEDLLFSNAEVSVNNGVVGIRVGTNDKNKVIGVSLVNMNECIINLIEFVDNDVLSNLESVLVQLSPKEALISGSNSQSDISAQLRTILNRHDILISEKKGSDFDTSNINQDLSRVLRVKSKDLHNIAANPELQKTLAVSALAAVIKYLELVTNEAYLNQFTLSPFDIGLYVKMDSAACEALHLTANLYESARDVSLTSIIDRCRTAQGHRLLSQYLRQPLMSQDALEERLDLVELFMKDYNLCQALHEEHLRRIPDCQVLARKFQRKKATLQDCYKTYLCLLKLPKLVTELENHCSDKTIVLNTYFIEPLQSLNPDFEKFKEMIQETLDLTLAEQGEFMVRSDFDEALQVLRRDMDSIKGRMEKEAWRVAEECNLDDKKSGVKLESSPKDGGFVLRVTLKDEKAIRNNKELSIVSSITSGVRFTTDTLINLNERYSAKVSLYDETQKDFMEEMMTIACDYYTCLEQLGTTLAKLDVFISLAVASNSASCPFVRPTLLPRGTGILSFKQLRHPCVEAQTGVSFIPNDVLFDKNGSSFYIVTGPNMGGKSTFLRSVGVATLLAHIGCFVPADKAEVSIVDSILARVGAGDCILKGVSTFMAEMIETSFILRTATADSLVLIDELGRGTSTYDGFGLCWAISENLAKKVKCFAVLATHFHELTELEEEVDSVRNVHVTAMADENGLAMLYKIEPGPCDRSFGLHVAQLTGFPPNVINRAREMTEKLENFSGGVEGGDDEASVKQRRIERKTGETMIAEFLATVEKLGESSIDEEDFQQKLRIEFDKVKQILGPLMPNLFNVS